jgi:hypothetical protein
MHARELEAMDRDEALRLLRGGKDGIAEWNRRRQAGAKIPDLTQAHLEGWLHGVDLFGARLLQATLSGAELNEAGLNGANLLQADLVETDLSGARLNGSTLRQADLRRSKLCKCNLRGTEFRETELEGCDFSRAHCGATVFANVDLSQVTGLDSVTHDGPSTIGIDSLFRSGGKIPEGFLRGCGVPDVMIADIPALVGALQPMQFCSCFISYSSKDEEFATRLHNDFQAAGIRCWKWDHDAQTGKSLWGEIDRAIRVHDKVILVASESSLKSPAVNREIERAIQQEDERTTLKQHGKYAREIDVLFPVRLDDHLFHGWEHERKADVTKKVVANARGWETKRGVYKKVLDRLLRDLKAETPPAT